MNSLSPPSINPARPRASPLWQIVHHAWDDFRAGYECAHRKTRHFGPSCHQRSVRRVGNWIAYTVCFDLPH